jgi:hypothetical protein
MTFRIKNRNRRGLIYITKVWSGKVVLLSIFHKFSQMLFGLSILFLIGSYLTREEQGFYYTFGSLVALQSFVDLGLCIVITNAASREWSKLDLGPDGCISGDPNSRSKLILLGRYAVKIFVIGSLAFLFVVGFGGYVFMGKDSATDLDWKTPWIYYIFFSSLSLSTMPFLALLEGCGQIQSVIRFRILQGLVGWVTFSISILLNAALWSTVALSFTSATTAFYYIYVNQRNFFKAFARKPVDSSVVLQGDVLPMQWRLAVSGLFNYFIFNLVTPIMFAYHGSIVAGQMGMSLQLISAAVSLGSVFINTESPNFGVLIARCQIKELNLIWKKALLKSLFFMLSLVIIINLLIYILSVLCFTFIQRVVPLSSFLCLSIGSFSILLGHCFAVYLRAHLVELFLPSAILTSLLMASLVWYFGSKNGVLGASMVYMVVHTFISLPMAFLIWRKARLNWGYNKY